VQIIWRYNPAGILGFIDESNGDIEIELDFDALNLSDIELFPFFLQSERFSLSCCLLLELLPW
jgi:hypothetical protein